MPELSQRTLGKVITALTAMVPDEVYTFSEIQDFWRTKLFEREFPGWLIDFVLGKHMNWSVIIRELFEGTVKAHKHGGIGYFEYEIGRPVCHAMLPKLTVMAFEESKNQSIREALRLSLQLDGFDVSQEQLRPIDGPVSVEEEKSRLHASLTRNRITNERPDKVGREGEGKNWDVFICHASEDKDSFVRPLAQALSASLKVWYDEMTLTVGDSLRQKIDHGLANSRYGIVVLSKAFFSKNLPQAELDGLISRAMAGTHIKVILPIWHGVSLQDVLKYSPILSGRLAADSKEGLDSVVAKLHAAMESDPTPKSHISGRQEIEWEPNEYYEQRRKLPDNAVFTEILTKPHWRISTFPIDFKKARFRNLDQCKDFVLSSCVPISGGISYPQFLPNALEIGSDYIACDTKASEWPLSRTERWVLFRSALFVQIRVFNENQQLGGRIHALEILDTATAAFEFATRMTQHVVLAPKIAITFGLHAVEGRQLTWPQDIFFDNDAVGRDCWCQEERIDVSRQVEVAEIAAQKRELALDVTWGIYSKFGWSEPPKDRLSEEQSQRFGAV